MSIATKCSTESDMQQEVRQDRLNDQLREIEMRICIALALFFGGALSAAPMNAADPKPLTFNRDIAPVIFKSCATCHHPGEVAPFSLLTYEDAKKHAKQIQTVTANRYMPPWKSTAECGPFIGERRLHSGDIKLIATWIEQGSMEGDPHDLPNAPEFRTGWKLGEPDVVLTMQQSCSIPADGPDIYRNFVFDVSVPEGKFIKAVEFAPGNRRVVHHAALSMDMDGSARRKNERNPSEGFEGVSISGELLPGSLAAWTPGRNPLPLPEGFSMPWKPGVGLVLQLHLHPSGKPETEKSSIGLYFTDQPPRQSMINLMLLNTKIDIPPGEHEYRSHDEFTLPIDMDLCGLFPHMHLLGREFKLTVELPSGDELTLLRINDWDFNWQSDYQFEKPVRLLAGSKIVMETVHDNSTENIHNPNRPPRRVKWGEQTTDEMAVALLQLVPVAESDLDEFRSSQKGRIIGGIIARQSNRRGP